MRDVYAYDSAFQNMAAARSANAARRVICALRTILQVDSVVDIGCARGTWLREWRAQGVNDIIGVDGSYVDRGKLEIDPKCFVERDLAIPLNLGRKFDLAQSLEVAEHLPPSRAEGFITDIVGHAPVVLFSAAPPGQGGENHLNEQPYEYWRSLFSRSEYLAIDCIRPLLVRGSNVPAWYRYNAILYVQRSSMDRIAPFARQFQLEDGEPLSDISPLRYKLRKYLVRALPRRLHDRLARWNARRFLADGASGP